MKRFFLIRNSFLARPRAFTMIELLLGLMIFSIIATAAYLTFSTGMRLSHRSETTNKIYRDARVSFDVIEKELESMVPYDFSSSYSDKYPFWGGKDKVSFILTSPDGLKQVSYYLSSEDESSVYQVRIGQRKSRHDQITLKDGRSTRRFYLIREERPFISYLTGNDSKAPEKEIISTDVNQNGLRFFFGYSLSELGEEIQWQDSWEINKVPSHVRLQIDFLNREEKAEIITITKDFLIPHGFLGNDELQDE